MEYRIREARRGVLPTIVLALLSKEALTANEIVERIENLGLRMPIGTVYPLLKRLEREGFIESERDVSGNKPRKRYRITPKGKEALNIMSNVLRYIFEVLKKVLWESQG